MGETQITGGDINRVLELARSLTTDGDAQLTILARAFVIGCRSCGVSAATALDVLAETFRDPVDLTPLAGAPRSDA